MAGTHFQRNYPYPKDLNKPLAIEMKEAHFDFAENETHKSQSNTIAYIRAQNQGLDRQGGSLLSLSKSFVDQSDERPLTIHPCRYDECHKFHHGISVGENSESPVSSLKNIILYLVITLLILWMIVYIGLSQLQVF